MSENMTTSEPTTGEIAVFIPMKKSKAIGIFNSINLGRWTQEQKDNSIKTILCAPVPKEISKERMSDVVKFLIDRLESQERGLSEKTEQLEKFKAFYERYAEQTSKKYVDMVCSLTARAEQAEKKLRELKGCL